MPGQNQRQNQKIQKYVSYKEADGAKFWFLDLGAESHGRTSFRLWVSHKLVQSREEEDWRGEKILKNFLTFPLEATITKTQKGGLVLKPAKNEFVYDILVECGYRGSSSFQVLSPAEFTVYSYYIYHSPRGNCGVSDGALVHVPSDDPLKIRWEKTGRLYGGPGQGVEIYYPDGRVEGLEMLCDGLEEVEELKGLIAE